MITVTVRGVSVFGPGLNGWADSAPILAGARAWVSTETPPPPPALLPANDRRRAGPPVRLAMAVAAEAVAMSGLPLALPRGVFASANGDGAVLNAILQALSTPDGQVSPTQFHNSVHNAVAANWTIGVGSTRPATSIGMHDDTFAAGLLKAAAEAAHEREPVLFCAYDAPMPEPLAAKRPTSFAFAAAFVLAPVNVAEQDDIARPLARDMTRPLARDMTCPLARLAVRYVAEHAGAEAWLPLTPEVRALATGNAAARGLRLLEAIARGAVDRFALPLASGRVEVEVTP